MVKNAILLILLIVPDNPFSHLSYYPMLVIWAILRFQHAFYIFIALIILCINTPITIVWLIVGSGLVYSTLVNRAKAGPAC